MLTSGHYIGIAEQEDNRKPFEEKMTGSLNDDTDILLNGELEVGNVFDTLYELLGFSYPDFSLPGCVRCSLDLAPYIVATLLFSETEKQSLQ